MKNKINYPRSLTEVWEWKERVYSKYKNIDDMVKNSERNTDETIKKLGLERISSQLSDFHNSK